jgi:hypothetical protein
LLIFLKDIRAGLIPLAYLYTLLNIDKNLMIYSLNYLRDNIQDLMKAVRKDSGRFVLYRQDNKALFSSLEELGVFEFYSTNAGHMLNRSQVIAFLFCGGYEANQRGYKAEKNYIEVHHINGVVDDDTEENLVYLSKQDHAYVSSCSYTPLFGRIPDVASTPFNKQGRSIKNPIHFIVNIIRQTVAAVSKARSSKEIKLNIATIVLALPKKLWKASGIYNQMPAWMKAEYIEILNPRGAYAC